MSPTPNYLAPTKCPQCGLEHFGHMIRGNCERAAEEQARMTAFRKAFDSHAQQSTPGGPTP